MTNEELIAKIKAEIERMKSIGGIVPLDNREQKIGYESALIDVETFLDTFESEKPVQNDLDKAAEISFDEADALAEDYMNFLAKGLTENQPRPIGPHWFCEYAKKRFIDGAKWAMEQNAVEGEIAKDNRGNNVLRAGLFNNGFEIGDKVRVIVLKKED